MGEGTDVSRLLAAYTKPDPMNPYMFNGVSYAPKRYGRVFRTSDDVIRHIAQAKVVRNLDDDGVASRTGLPRETIERLATKGEGSLDDFLTVTDALGVSPVCVPNYIVLGRGRA